MNIITKSKSLISRVLILTIVISGIGFMAISVSISKQRSAQAATISYDVVVVGGGASGVAAAIQASRMGSKVAVVEETDLLGGQLLTVATMDEGLPGATGTERVLSGIYTDFASRVTAHYAALGKNVNTFGFGPNNKMAFEPAIVDTILRDMMTDATSGTAIVIYTRTKAATVKKSGSTVTGITTNTGNTLTSKILIDATEYGDLLPLAGAEYRIGNVTSTSQNPNVGSACIQDITYTEIVKRYTTSTPSNLITNVTSTGYTAVLARFQGIVKTTGGLDPFNPPVNWTKYPQYRGTPDSSTSTNYTAAEYWLISKTFDNWANDYPGSTSTSLSAKYLSSSTYRIAETCNAKVRTLDFLYYAQKNGRSTWSVDDASGFNTPHNASNTCSNVTSSLKTIEKLMPLRPYVRESRRMVGSSTLNAQDIIAARDSSTTSPIWPDALALGYYALDLHGCNTTSSPNTLEALDGTVPASELQRYGAFPIPYGSFIPKVLNGFLAAEKNISQTRIANGGTRLQPSVMRIGQAVGALAALSIQKATSTRNVKATTAQKAILKTNFVKLSPYTFDDVATSSPYWWAAEMMSMRKIMVGTGPNWFGVSEATKRQQTAVMIVKAFNIPTSTPPTPTFSDVTSSSPFYPYVEGMAAAGLTAGCGGGLFCPVASTTRAQYAVFVSNAMGFASSSATTTMYYADVNTGTVGWQQIQILTEKGLLTGCGGSNFCPTTPITRGQAAELTANGIAY